MPATLPPIAVFDLDGTLAETAPDLIATLNLILEREGLAAVPLARARDLIGHGARALIQRGFELHGRDLAPARLEALFDEFLDLYLDRVADESHLFPGVEAALDELTAGGFALAVCTNKPELHSRKLLEALGIAGRFGAICGRDTFAMFKPDPRHLTLTIEAAGGDPGRAVLIGDSQTDVDTARAAGVPSLVVPFGYTQVPARELGGDAFAETFAEVPAAIRSLVGAGEPEAVVGATGFEPVTPAV